MSDESIRGAHRRTSHERSGGFPAQNLHISCAVPV
jgi:hypothetical protein